MSPDRIFVMIVVGVLSAILSLTALSLFPLGLGVFVSLLFFVGLLGEMLDNIIRIRELLEKKGEKQ